MSKQIIYTCPKCFHDLQDLCLPTYPPKYVKACLNCGWRVEESTEQIEPTEIIRVPYGQEMKE